MVVIFHRFLLLSFPVSDLVGTKRQFVGRFTGRLSSAFRFLREQFSLGTSFAEEDFFPAEIPAPSWHSLRFQPTLAARATRYALHRNRNPCFVVDGRDRWNPSRIGIGTERRMGNPFFGHHLGVEVRQCSIRPTNTLSRGAAGCLAECGLATGLLG